MTDAPESADSDPPPTRAALERLRAALEPNGRLGEVRPLGGGISSFMHAVELVSPGGARREVVMRLYGDDRLERNPRVAEQERVALEALYAAGLPVPELLLADPDGEMFGRPGVVTTLLPGRPLLDPRDPRDWARQLAATLARIHAVELPPEALAQLDDQGAELDELVRGPEPERRIAEHPDGVALWQALRDARGGVPPGDRLVHGDYWPGNTLWENERLVAVVDWEQPARGHPEADLAYCRLDLSLLGMPEAAAELVPAYAAAAGREPEALAFWDGVAAQRPMPDPVVWFGGYAELGRADLTPRGLRRNLRAFIADALARLERS